MIQFDQSYRATLHIIRCFYALTPLLILESEWRLFNVLANPPTDCLWVCRWFCELNFPVSKYSVYVFLLVTSILTATQPHLRMLRWFSFFGTLTMGGWVNSYGKIFHSHHLWISVSFLLALIPSGTQNRRKNKYAFLVGVWWANLYIFFAYTAVGAMKIIPSIIFPDWGWIGPNHLIRVILAHKLKMGHGLLDATHLDSIHSIFALVGVSTFILFASSLFVFLLRSGIRTWSFLIICFHLATYLAIEITFLPNIVLVVLFGLFCPFRKLQSNLFQPRRLAPFFFPKRF